MRALIVVALLGLTWLPVAPASAAPVETIGVCHLGGNGRWVYLRVPESQFHFTRTFHLPGHARHTAVTRDRIGLTERECLALNGK